MMTIDMEDQLQKLMETYRHEKEPQWMDAGEREKWILVQKILELEKEIRTKVSFNS